MSTDLVSKTCNDFCACNPGQTAVVTGTATGGLAPYTYLWSIVSGQTAIQPNNTTSNSTRFGISINVDCTPYPPSIQSAIWRLKVTDSIGNIAFGDVDVTVEMKNLYDTGGPYPQTCC
jgi:hypothetical protein